MTPDEQELFDTQLVEWLVSRLNRDYRLRVDAHGTVTISKKNYGTPEPRPAPSTPPTEFW